MLHFGNSLKLIHRDGRVVYLLVQFFGDFAAVVEFPATRICIQPSRSFRAVPRAFNILAIFYSYNHGSVKPNEIRMSQGTSHRA